MHETDVAIIGAGFGGLGAAIRLKQEGSHDFVVLERAPDIGGTWFANTYPGCECDVPSNLSGSVWNTGGCRSWYLDANGRNSVQWPDFTFKFRRRTAWFDSGDYRLQPEASEVRAHAH